MIFSFTEGSKSQLKKSVAKVILKVHFRNVTPALINNLELF